jgi:undecaprenyl diphosphate synthase
MGKRKKNIFTKTKNLSSLKHVAIIPDGNRRWAKANGFKQVWKGHEKGAERLKEILKAAYDLKLPCLTLWAGSLDNLTKRPKSEIKLLFKIYKKWFQKLLREPKIHQEKVRINILGRWQEILPSDVKKIAQKLIASTKNYSRFFLTFLLAYNGTDEMQECIKKIVELSKKQKNLKITPELIKENLWTKDLPPVDLIIRTGCENDPHWSAGFMMWDSAYSQLYFTKTLFPDFGAEEFKKIIDSYYIRERKFGA